MSKLSVRSVGQELSEESIAVLFAKYSRSDKSIIHEIKNLECSDSRLSKEDVQYFHSKWTIGFGHRSIAEHATLHFAIEGLSILAAKALEDTRLASFTEKSTRYVRFDRENVFLPADDGPDSKQFFLTAYGQLLDGYDFVRSELEKRLIADGVSPKEARLRAFDAARALLPVGCLTGLGMTVNANSLSRCLNKLLASSLPEVRNLGRHLLQEALSVAPSLVRHIQDEGKYELLDARSLPFIRPISTEAAAIDVDLQRLPHQQDIVDAFAFDLAEGKSEMEVRVALRAAVGARGPHDRLPRAFEYADLTASILMDYGSFRDLQRHRIPSLISHLPTCRLGWVLPSDVAKYGLEGTFTEVMQRAAASYESAVQSFGAASATYLVPLGYRVSALWKMNLREFAYIVELRTKSTAHENYKNVMVQLLRKVVREEPWILTFGLIRGAQELLESTNGC